jgi:hypothetical protein
VRRRRGKEVTGGKDSEEGGEEEAGVDDELQ